MKLALSILLAFPAFAGELRWNRNPEADISHYVLQIIGNTLGMQYEVFETSKQLTLPVGIYAVKLWAVSSFGLMSDPAEAEATSITIQVEESTDLLTYTTIHTINKIMLAPKGFWRIKVSTP